MTGKIGYLKNDLLRETYKDMTFRIDKHNKYSTLEALEQMKKEKAKVSLLGGGPVEIKRILKYLFYKLPFKPILRFLYMYIFRLGFLDGYPGFVFCILAGIKDFYINVKIKELKTMKLEEISEE